MTATSDPGQCAPRPSPRDRRRLQELEQVRIGRQHDRRVVAQEQSVCVQRAQETVELGVLLQRLGEDSNGLRLGLTPDDVGLFPRSRPNLDGLTVDPSPLFKVGLRAFRPLPVCYPLAFRLHALVDAAPRSPEGSRPA